MRSGLKMYLAGAAALAMGCLVSSAAQFVTDFNSGVPAGSAVFGTAIVDSSGGIGNSGVLKLTIAANGQAGYYNVSDIASGNAVTNFRVAYRVAIGGGTGRPADGMAFSFGSDVAGVSFGEEGTGTGITVTFDTWDNNADGSTANGDSAPSIDVKYGGATLAFQAMDPSTFREGGRAPAGPVLTNSAGTPVNLQTLGPQPAVPNDGSFVNVIIDLFSDNTISVSFSNVVVFDHLPIPYVPIVGGTFAFGARTGGANEDAWVDNLGIAVNFKPSPVTEVDGPADQGVFETQRASFTVTSDGTPPVSVQWFKNGAVIPGANEFTYVTPPTTPAMNGDTYRADVFNPQNNGTPVSSRTATLTVTPGVVLVSASSHQTANNVYVEFSKPVTNVGTYTLSPPVTVNAHHIGATPNEVILDVAPLTINTLYTLTVANEVGADTTPLIPNPSTAKFNYGFGPFCHDFNDNLLPAGCQLAGVAAIADGFVHLANADQFGACGDLWIPDQMGGSALDRLQARWSSYIGDGGGGGADGYSFSWGSDLQPPNGTCYGGEEGAGGGVSVTVDTFDNGGGEVGIEIRWQGARIAFTPIAKDDPGNGIFLRKSRFVDAAVEVLPDGSASFNYDGTILTAQIPGFAPISGGNFLFAARTGGASDNEWVDNVRINCFTLAPPTFVVQPASTTIIEGDLTTFTAVVDGAPPLTIQWYTNGVPVPGATTGSLLIGPGTAALNGLQVSAVAGNGFGTTLSDTATLTVTLAPRLVKVAMGCDPGIIRVLWTKPVQLDGSYETDITLVNGLVYGDSQSEVLLQIDPLSEGQTANITITDVHDTGNNVQYPNPATGKVLYGFASFCVDFNDNQKPAGTQLNGVAAIADGFVHLVDDGVNSSFGSFFIADPSAGATVGQLHATWSQLIGGVDQTGEAQQFNQGGADGISFSWGPDVNNGNGGPDGMGNGLIVTVDTFDNGSGCGLPDCGGEAPSIDIKWKGREVAANFIGPDPTANKHFLRKGIWVNAEADVFPDGTAQFTYDGVTVVATLPGWAGITGGNFNFSSSTGGAQDNQWIDNICLNAILPDTNGPVLSCSSPLLAECAGGLTPVTYDIRGFDHCDGPAPVVCVPPSGTGFRLGSSNVVCTASDNHGNTSTCSFEVVVVDTTPPVVTCPGDISATATSPAGAVVSYVASASDSCGIVSFDCSPTSGSTFPLGTNVVTCTAGNVSGLTNSCSFNVVVGEITNKPPVCVIGAIPCAQTVVNDPNSYVISLDGTTASVKLDASGSTDPDGDTLTYSWTIDGAAAGTGASITATLDVGCHTVAVTVDDGKGGTSTCTKTVCVITGGDAVDSVITLLDNSDLGRKNKRPLIASLKAAGASFDRGDFVPAMNQLEAFQHKVAAQLKDFPAEAAALIESTQKILDAIDCSAAAALGQ